MSKTSTSAAIIATIFLLIVLAFPREAAAQFGACGEGFYPMALPANSTPATAVLCVSADALSRSSGGARAVNFADSSAPCGDVINLTSDLTSPSWPVLQLVPPSDMAFPVGARIVLLGHASGRINQNTDLNLEIRAYSANGTLLSLVEPTPDFEYTDTQGRRWYEYDTLLSLAFSPRNGYATITIRFPTPLQSSEVSLAQMQIVPIDSNLEPLCLPVGVASPTPSITPSPSPTIFSPNPTGTPIPIPTNTPRATAAPSTPLPLPTATPYQSVPVEALPTGTAVPVTSYDPVAFPTLLFPDVPNVGNVGAVGAALTPNATRQAQNEQIETWTNSTIAMTNSWITNTSSAIGWLNPELTASTGISTPLQIGNEMAATFTEPISTVRALAIYMPNLWPYLLLIFLMLLWIFFNLLFKFAIAIIESIMNFIYSLWEAIPFN